MTSNVFSHTKVCTKCKIEKHHSEFSKRKTTKDGLRSSCKSCDSIASKSWHSANKERRSISKKIWHSANRDKRCDDMKEWRDQNKTHVSEYNKEWRERNKDFRVAFMKKWRESNKDSTNAHTAKRRAQKLQAVPLWFESNDIKSLYDECKRMTEISGIAHNVDHIVPLQSDIVCGLHCFANLRIITAEANKSKGNRYWPDMP